MRSTQPSSSVRVVDSGTSLITRAPITAVTAARTTTDRVLTTRHHRQCVGRHPRRRTHRRRGVGRLLLALLVARPARPAAAGHRRARSRSSAGPQSGAAVASGRPRALTDVREGVPPRAGRRRRVGPARRGRGRRGAATSWCSGPLSPRTRAAVPRARHARAAPAVPRAARPLVRPARVRAARLDRPRRCRGRGGRRPLVARPRQPAPRLRRRARRTVAASPRPRHTPAGARRRAGP